MQLSQRTINFDSLYEDFGELLEAAGFRKVLNKDTVKEARITVAWHLVVGRPLPAIEQLTEGNLIVIMLVVKFFTWLLRDSRESQVLGWSGDRETMWEAQNCH